MQYSQRAAALSATLRFVIACDMPSQHKATLIDVLTQAMREESAAELRRHTVSRAQGEWRDHEIMELRSFLQENRNQLAAGGSMRDAGRGAVASRS